MRTFKPGADILDEVPYIFLVPGAGTLSTDLSLITLNSFLYNHYGITSIGIQSQRHFEVEEKDFVLALKQGKQDKHFCALKVIFTSYFDLDLDLKLQILYSLKEKYGFELFDGKSFEHLPYNKEQMCTHIKAIQQFKKEELLHDILPAYSLN